MLYSAVAGAHGPPAVFVQGLFVLLRQEGIVVGIVKIQQCLLFSHQTPFHLDSSLRETFLLNGKKRETIKSFFWCLRKEELTFIERKHECNEIASWEK